MAQDKSDKAPLATTATFATNDEPDRGRIEAMLDQVAPGIIAETAEGRPVAGWHLLSELKFEALEIGNADMPFIPKDRAEHLVTLAATNPHAFDLASHLAGQNVLALKIWGADLSPPLSAFAFQVLTGKVTRPPQPGRPRADTTFLLRLWQYGLCLFVAKETPLHLTRNDEPGRRRAVEIFTACDAVAQAFTRAGKHTTYANMKSLCYDKANGELRELVKYLGVMEDPE